MAWLGLVWPALVLNYYGQGALVLSDPAAAENPFFAMAPKGAWAFGLVILSAAATVIASQALISGAFSLTHQAVQLGFFPRVAVRHTSRETEGQIYVPEINWFLAIACVTLVLVFRESSRLAAAYGIAVTGTMAITSVMYFEVTRRTWKWPLWKSLPLLLLFLSFDVPFFVANLFKFLDGGYVPVLVAAVITIVMVTWKRGRGIYLDRVGKIAPPFDEFCGELGAKVSRVPGSCVFLTGRVTGAPLSLVHYVDRIRVLPETVILLTVEVRHQPYVPEDTMHFETLPGGIQRLTIERGFMDVSDIPALLAIAVERFGLAIDPKTVTYCAGRDTFLATSAGEMGAISESLFAFLARNSRSPAAHFCIPPSQLIEIGSQIDL